MKFFHLSDLHIGKQLFRYNLKSEQQYMLRQVVQEVQKRKPDVIVIAGDIYDKSVPSAEAVQIFDAFLTDLAKLVPAVPVLVIAGNHDSGDRLDYAKDILRRENIYISGRPPADDSQHLTKVTVADAYGNVNFYLLPFTKPGHVRNMSEESLETYDDAIRYLLGREEIDTNERNVLLTHQFYINGGNEPTRSESEIIKVGSIDSVDVSALFCFDYAAMGHLHRMQYVKEERFAYSGTLYPYSVSEAQDEKGFFEVILNEKGTYPEITKVLLEPLRGVCMLRGTMEEIMSQKQAHGEDYVSIVLTEEQIPYDAKETLESGFSHILEIRFDNAGTRKLLAEFEADVESTDPLDVFCSFFRELHQRELSEEEKKEVVDVVNMAKEWEDR